VRGSNVAQRECYFKSEVSEVSAGVLGDFVFLLGSCAVLAGCGGQLWFVFCEKLLHSLA
jgi:hypothetical protein